MWRFSIDQVAYLSGFSKDGLLQSRQLASLAGLILYPLPKRDTFSFEPPSCSLLQWSVCCSLESSDCISTPTYNSLTAQGEEGQKWPVNANTSPGKTAMLPKRLYLANYSIYRSETFRKIRNNQNILFATSKIPKTLQMLTLWSSNLIRFSNIAFEP